MTDYSNIITISQDFKGGQWFAEGQKDLCGHGETPQKALDDLLCKEKYTILWEEAPAFGCAPAKHYGYLGAYSFTVEKNYLPKNLQDLKAEWILIASNNGSALNTVLFRGISIQECKNRAQELINNSYKKEIEGGVR